MIVPLLRAATLVLGTATIVFVTLAIAGRRDASCPRCRTCREDLAPSLLAGAEACPKCGASLAVRGAVRPPWRWSRSSVWLGLGVAVVLFSGSLLGEIVLQARLASVAGPGAMIVPPIPVGAILDGIPPGEDPFLHSLLMRVRDGTDSPERLRTSLLEALARPDAAPSGSSRQTLLRIGAALLEVDLRDPEVLGALLALLEPTPVLRVRRHTMQGRTRMLVEIRPHDQPASDAPSETNTSPELWSTQIVRAVRVNGRPVEIVAPSWSRPKNLTGPFALSSEGFAVLVDSIDDGDLIEIDLEAVLYDSFDGVRLARLEHRVPEGCVWPTPLASASRTAMLVIGTSDGHEPTQTEHRDRPPGRDEGAEDGGSLPDGSP